MSYFSQKSWFGSDLGNTNQNFSSRTSLNEEHNLLTSQKSFTFQFSNNSEEIIDSFNPSNSQSSHTQVQSQDLFSKDNTQSNFSNNVNSNLSLSQIFQSTQSENSPEISQNYSPRSFPKYEEQESSSKMKISNILTNESFTQDSEVDDDLNFIPKSILQVYEFLKNKHSEWTFISVIVGQLCQETFPFGTYNNLKLSLLLSIAASGGDFSSLIPIVAIGKETSHANILMTCLGRFTGRFISAINFENTVKKNGTVEAGPLLLARGGVLKVGDWSGISGKNILKLMREIETGTVTIEQNQQSFPLNSTVWCYWSCSTEISKDITTIKQFMNVFGVPILIDDHINETEIIDDLLESATKIDENFSISENDMREYLSYAAKVEVTMEPQAEKILKDYFQATRIIRPNALTPKAFEILKKMTESYAKLCLRKFTSPVDALAAISISEKYIKVLFEKDSYSSPDEEKITSIDDFDKYQHRLHTWLSTFTEDILNK